MSSPPFHGGSVSIDGIEYSGGTMELILTEEGRITRSGSTYTYHYFLRDHLGNNRVGFAQGTNVTTPNFTADYYPFGLQYRQYIRAGSPKNNYLYNRKELQDGIKQYDYGARLYDPVIGRWGAVDPLAESFQPYSPYNYGLNNPIVMVDPTGMASMSTHTDSAGNEIAVYDDGDLGVYYHNDATSKSDIDAKRELSKTTSGGGEKMGETEYWDEFREHNNETGAVLNSVVGRIMFDESWDLPILLSNMKANSMGLSDTWYDFRY